MENNYRRYIYAFLSRIFTDVLDERFIKDLKNNDDLLTLIGESTKAYFLNNTLETLNEELNVDFTSMFILNSQPIESFILDHKSEVLVGLQNPVMSFYFRHGFEIDMNQTSIVAPDHLSIEFAFMQSLVHQDNKTTQVEFLEEHIMQWVIPYMQGMSSMSSTPFYRDICDFVSEFLVSDYDKLSLEEHLEQ